MIDYIITAAQPPNQGDGKAVGARSMEGITKITDDDDPERCQGVTHMGQCRCRAVYEGMCKIHDKHGSRKIAKTEVSNYRLNKWQARVDEFAESDKVKSLREEIGITRILIEEIINRCQNSTELILMSGKISDLVMKSEKLVSSCHRLEAATGALLDRTAILQMAGVLVEIIGEHIKDDNVLAQISERILLAVAPAEPPPSLIPQ